MTKDTMKEAAVAAEALLFDDWFDAIEDGVRARVRGFIETMLEEELSEALSRPRYGRRALLASGQITMRKVDGWQTLAEKPDNQIIDLAA